MAGLVAAVVFGATLFAFAGSSGADVSDVSGGAYGHYTSVSLFGGPAVPKGPAPTVTLPSSGADPALTASEPSASAVYGPATIFGGKWPRDVTPAPPSGPITVSTKGTTGPGGSVTSTADIVLRDPPDAASPGGFGPEPPTQGDELHSTCTASETGATGSARFVNAVLALSTDPQGNPTDEEAVPDNPPVNYTKTGQLTNVGDSFKIVYNEQIVDADGAITVNAVHLFLLGPTAVGEQILGQVRCSIHAAAAAATTPSSSPADSSPPAGSSSASGAATSTGNSSAAPSTTATTAKTGIDLEPVAFAAAGLVAGGAILVLSARRRRVLTGGRRRNAR